MPEVIYDLYKSCYIVIEGGKYRFYFSTRKNMERFLRIKEEKIAYVKTSLLKRFQINFDFYKIGIIWAYKKAETNGFLVWIDGEYYTAEDVISLD